MSPPSNRKSKESVAARLAGSGTSGILELLGFHPVDTVAKRLMNNQEKVTKLENFFLFYFFILALVFKSILYSVTVSHLLVFLTENLLDIWRRKYNAAIHE